MWAHFTPVKDRNMVVKVAEAIMRYRPVKIISVNGWWRLSIKIGEGKQYDMGKLGNTGA